MLINHGRQIVNDLNFALQPVPGRKIQVFVVYGKYTDANSTWLPEWTSTHCE
jgi:hypothetical protein